MHYSRYIFLILISPARKLFFLSTVFFYSTVIGTLFFIRKCLFVELRHRMIKSRLFLVRNCLLVEFDSIVGSKLIYQSVWRALRMKRQTVSSDMKSKRMIKNEGPLKSALICRILVSSNQFFKVQARCKICSESFFIRSAWPVTIAKFFKSWDALYTYNNFKELSMILAN